MAHSARLGMNDVGAPVLRSVPEPEPVPERQESVGQTTGPLPGVTVALPVLNEAAHIEGCLQAVMEQTYRRIVEILVIDGGSDDTTREMAARFPGVRVIDNPGRRQSAGLNVALREAR